MDDKRIMEKYVELISFLQEKKKIAVAYSGGVDSTFLLMAAKEALGENVLAITVRSSFVPQREYQEALQFTKDYHISHQVIVVDEMEIEKFRSNPVNRCYFCKRQLFLAMYDVAKASKISTLVDGSNVDDEGDFRPGLVALKELEVVSPLRLARLSKEEIRWLSLKKGLYTWDKPSYACLASRFPYGEVITKEKLKMVELAEMYLFDLGIKQGRVRIHGNIARIELEEKERYSWFEHKNQEQIVAYFNKIGFAYVTLDLKGYRTGSMNEVVDEEEKRKYV